MINNNILWEELNGGYKTIFNASIPLRELTSATDEKKIDSIFHYLWDNLHHQGDVGLASYYSVPELVDICITKKSFDWNFIGLCMVIEHCRRHEDNPPLPPEFESLYFNSLDKLEIYLLENFKKIKEETAVQVTLSLFATLSGQVEMGLVILNLDKDIRSELLENYGW